MSPLKEISSTDNEQLETGEENIKELKLRTLKEARFLWKIKGNYHLKDTGSDVNEPEHQSGASSSTETMNLHSDSSVSEQSAEVVQPPVLCNHFQSLQTGIDSTSNSETQNSSMQPTSLGASSGSFVVCDTYNVNFERTSLPFDGESPKSPPLSTSHHDCVVRKWQTVQLARAFMDNTINSILDASILDAIGFIPVPELLLDSDALNVLHSDIPLIARENAGGGEKDESVENEGILSAIQRHGLQRHALISQPEVSDSLSRSYSSSQKSTDINQELMLRPAVQPSINAKSFTTVSELGVASDEQMLYQNDTKTFDSNPSQHKFNVHSNANGLEEKNMFSSSCECAFPTSRVAGTCQTCSSYTSSTTNLSDYNNFNDDQNTVQKPKKALSSLSSDADKSLDGFDAVNVDQENESFKKRQNKSSFLASVCKRRCPESSYMESDRRALSASDTDRLPVTTAGTDGNSPTFGHFEFMDAAVAAAIQKKGLSALACQDM